MKTAQGIICEQVHADSWRKVGSFAWIKHMFTHEIARHPHRRDEQELAILSLHLLQLVMVFTNTVMTQTVLQELAWKRVLTVEGYRALTPLG